MAQHDYDISNQTFPSFRSDLNSVLEAINTSNSGTSRPSSAVAGTIWLDVTNATNPTLKFFDGNDDISLATLDYTANTVNWIDSTVIFDIVNDTTPQLGGNLDVNGNSLVSTSNGNITFTPDGTGKVVISGLNYPTSDGTADQVLTTDGSGNLSFSDISGGTSWQSSIVTGTTLSAVAGNGYWIDTTSNACTVTLPASASVGDTIEIVDYARTWGTNAVTINQNSLNFQGFSSPNPEYNTNGQSVRIVYSGATQGWIPTVDDDVTNQVPQVTQRGIFAFGDTGSPVGMSNLMDSSGVIGSDVAAVGTSYLSTGATNYGGDKAIYAYGYNGSSATNKSNLVSNLGVVASDTTGVGTARTNPGATAYGSAGKAIFAYGYGSDVSNIQNQVSSSGVIATDTTGVGTARDSLGAAMYGGDKGIFGYGNNSTGGDNGVATTNLISNVGVIGSDVSGVGTARYALAATSYGGDKAIFGFGYRSGVGSTAISNKVSNTGVVASDTSGVGTVRYHLGAASYGGDKGAFAYGRVGGTRYSTKNLISNTGVVASDTSGVGTARSNLKGAEYSFSS